MCVDLFSVFQACQALSRFDLSPEFVWEQLNSSILFLVWSSLAHAVLVLALLVITMPFASALGWLVRIIVLTLLDGAYALSGLQLAKVRFAHRVEARAKGTWEGWLLVHGGLDYMRRFVAGAGPAVIALVHWPLGAAALVGGHDGCTLLGLLPSSEVLG